jgi:NAD(P)H-binding
MTDPILVIGGTRGTGQAVVEQLIREGRSCTVLARNVAKAQKLFGDTVEIIYGDVTRPDTLKTVFTSAFAAIVYTVDITGGVGGRGFLLSRQRVSEVVYNGIANTVDAAQCHGFDRQFILLTTLGLEQLSPIMMLLNLIKPGVVEASQNKAACLIQSGLPYTIVQAGALHNGQDSGQPLVITQGNLPMRLNYRISRQHLARVLVATIDSPVTIGKTFNVYGGAEGQLTGTVIASQLQKLR